MANRNNELPVTSPGGLPELRRLRKAVGLTLAQVAAEAGCTAAQVSRAERGVRHAPGRGRVPKRTRPETAARIRSAIDRLIAPGRRCSHYPARPA